MRNNYVNNIPILTNITVSFGKAFKYLHENISSVQLS